MCRKFETPEKRKEKLKNIMLAGCKVLQNIFGPAAEQK